MELNGTPTSIEQVKALALINYGHFTSMLVKHGAVRGLSLHLERLSRDCRRLFDAELDPDQVKRWVRKMVANIHEPTVARVTVFDPELQLGRPGSEAHPHVLVSTRAAPVGALTPLRVRSTVYSRELPSVKHVGLFGTVLRRREAQRGGFDDVLLVDSAGTIAEGSTWNVGFFDGERVLWPKAEQLAGVTMALLNAHYRGPIAHEAIKLERISQMHAAFATNAAVGVRTISAIDGRSFAEEHEVMSLLREAYAAAPLETL